MSSHNIGNNILIALFSPFWSTVCPTWLTKQFVWASGVAKDLDSDCYWRKKTRHEIWRYARKKGKSKFYKGKTGLILFQIRYVWIAGHLLYFQGFSLSLLCLAPSLKKWKCESDFLSSISLWKIIFSKEMLPTCFPIWNLVLLPVLWQLTRSTPH